MSEKTTPKLTHTVEAVFTSQPISKVATGDAYRAESVLRKYDLVDVPVHHTDLDNRQSGQRVVQRKTSGPINKEREATSSPTTNG